MIERFSSPQENQENNRQKHIKWAQDRAIRHLNKGKLKEAIDSMVSDINKYKENGREASDKDQQLMIMMGSVIRNDPNLTAEKALRWIMNGPEEEVQEQHRKLASSYKAKPTPMVSESAISRNNSKKEYQPKTDEDFEKYAKLWLDKFSLAYRGPQLDSSIDDLKAWSGDKSVIRERRDHDALQDDEIRNKFYPGWTDADFRRLLAELKKILKLGKNNE